MPGIRCIILILCTLGLHAQPLSVTYSPQHTCSLKGSSVLLTCKYTNLQNYRFSKGYWYKTDSQKHTSVVQEEFSSSQCSLRLNNLTPDSSGVYDYRIQTTSRNLLKGTNGVTVNVWDALHKDCWGVSYSSTSFCVLKGSTVDIPCTYGHPRDHTVNTTLWFKVGKEGVQSQDLLLEEQYQGRVEHLSTEDYNCTLRIRDMREADLGEYRFRYTTNKPGGVYSGGLVTIDVSDLRVSMAADTATEGENVTMTCNTNCIMDGNTTFIWYKNTQLTRHTGIINTLHLNLVSKEDAGNYSCAVAGLEHHPSPEATLSVKYAPWNTAVLAAPPGDTAEGDSVTLTCSSDANPPVHSYTWYMKRGTQNSLLGTGQSYVAANISHEASGLYYCVAQNSVGEHASTAVAVPIAGQGSAGNAAIGILAVVVVPLVLSLLWLRKRKSNRPPKQGSTSTSQQSALPDPNDDTYTSLNNSTRCPDYDTLNITLPDPNEDTYTSLNSSTRCPEYDTLNITLPDPNEDTYTSLNSSTRCPEYDTLNTMRRPTGENDSILVRVTPAPAFRL